MAGSDPKAVRAALINAGRAGVADRIRIERREWSAVEPPAGWQPENSDYRALLAGTPPTAP